MFGSALDKVTGFLDQRMVLTSLLPSIAFWAAVAALAGGQVGWPRALRWWAGLSSGSNLLLAVVAVAILVLFALVLSACEGALLSLYEGYWGHRGPGEWLARSAANWRADRVKRLNQELRDLDDAINNLPDEIAQLNAHAESSGQPADQATIELKQAELTRTIGRSAALFEHRYRNYPVDPGNVLPTRLGNILKAAEQYPADDGHYGMDAVFFWPRLFAVIPTTVREDLSDARASLALLLNVCTLALVLTAGTLVALVVTAAHPAAAYWACAAAAFVVAGLTHRSALAPARVYAELVRTAFDLYRTDLLSRLKLAEPDSLAQERDLWANLGQQMYRGAANDTALLDAARKRAAGQADAVPAPAPDQ